MDNRKSVNRESLYIDEKNYNNYIVGFFSNFCLFTENLEKKLTNFCMEKLFPAILLCRFSSNNPKLSSMENEGNNKYFI